MVVHDLDVLRPIVSPDKANSELIIDSDAVLPCTVSPKGLQSIAGGHPQFLQTDNRIQVLKFSDSHRPECPGARLASSLRVSAVEQVLRAGVSESPDHIATIARISCYDKA